MSVVCCQVEVSVTGQSVVLLSVVCLEPDLETSTIRRPRPTRTAEPQRRGRGGGGENAPRKTTNGTEKCTKHTYVSCITKPSVSEDVLNH